MHQSKLNPESGMLKKSPWLRPKDLEPLMKYVDQSSRLKRQVFGRSEEGRELQVVYWGKGPKRLLMWSQMHGNEATATHALDHFFQYLSEHVDLEFNLEEELSLAMIPMLNPDGAERFQRRNALGIDLNRDALAQASKEMQAFYQLLHSFKPHWAFNMHDQRSIFSVGPNDKPATLSFLAPSPNEARSISPERKASMQFISALYRHLEPELPGHFGKYSDEFYPRAIGDNLMKAGIPNILFEAGFHPDDPLRFQACQLMYKALVKSLPLMVNQTWEEQALETYDSIPENKKGLKDLILREVTFKNCPMDIALMRIARPNSDLSELETTFEIVDIGDLSHFKGIQEIKGGQIQSDSDLNINQSASFELRADKIYRFINGKLQ